MGARGASAQDVYAAGDPQNPQEVFAGVAQPAPDLHKYLTRDGRFIDSCAYWKDHPDADTLRYGQPRAFARGGPSGETRSFNGQPAPYVRCALNPCPDYGTICWINPAKPTPPSQQLQAILKAQGCEAESNGDIFCGGDQQPHPGPRVAGASHPRTKSKCHVVGNSVACDPTETFAGHDSDGQPPTVVDGGPPFPTPIPKPVPEPQPTVGGETDPKYTPVDTTLSGPCEEATPGPDVLAQPPEDGDVAIAYLMAPDGGDVAVARPLDGARGVVLAKQVTLTGGISTDRFTVPDRTLLRGATSVNGWPTAPSNPARFSLYATKSLRVPITYKPVRQPPPAAPGTLGQVPRGRYSAEVAQQRFLAGFLQCMDQELIKLTPRPNRREYHRKNREFNYLCQFEKAKTPPGKIPQIIENPFRDEVPDVPDTPDAPEIPVNGKYLEKVSTLIDMFDEAVKHQHDLEKAFPQFARSLGLIGPLAKGSALVEDYAKVLKKLYSRDKQLRKDLAAADRAGTYLDPKDVGCLAGRDAADAYAYYVKTGFQLSTTYDPVAHPPEKAGNPGH
ncbi:MAG: hypothetical protein JSR36_15310 [Proteobacteria bacterium]|nr:hypothetical protein [Pseudomonadota bacterium]